MRPATQTRIWRDQRGFRVLLVYSCDSLPRSAAKRCQFGSASRITQAHAMVYKPLPLRPSSKLRSLVPQ